MPCGGGGGGGGSADTVAVFGSYLGEIPAGVRTWGGRKGGFVCCFLEYVNGNQVLESWVIWARSRRIEWLWGMLHNFAGFGVLCLGALVRV